MSDVEATPAAAPWASAETPARARSALVARAVGGLGLAVFALWLPTYYQPTTVLLVSEVLYIAIAAMGLNLVTGFNGQVSIGHGAFFGVGAFTSGILVAQHGWTFELTIPVAAVVSAAVGVAVGIPALRVKGLYLALITLGMAVLFPVLANKFVKGTGGIALLQPKRGQVSSYFPDLLKDDQYTYFVCLVLLVVLFLVAYLLLRSRAGRAIIAVRDQEVAATTVGIDVARVKVFTFAISAAYAGIAGSLYFMVNKIADATNPLVYFQMSIEFLIAVVIGGAATIAGPLLGAIVLVVIRENSDESTDLIPRMLGLEERTAQLAPAILGALLIVITYVMPDGVVGGLRRLSRKIGGLASRSSRPSDPDRPASHPTSQEASP